MVVTLFCCFKMSHMPCSFPVFCKKSGVLAARASYITLGIWIFITIKCPNLSDKHLISDMGCINSCCCLTFQNICYLSCIMWTSLPSTLSSPHTEQERWGERCIPDGLNSTSQDSEGTSRAPVDLGPDQEVLGKSPMTHFNRKKTFCSDSSLPL